MTRLALALVVILIVAGCSSNADLSAPTPSPTPSPSSTTAEYATTNTSVTTSSRTSTTLPTATPTATPTPTPILTPTPRPANNPWGEPTITVGIENDAGLNRSYRPLVKRALAYWEENAGKYTRFSEVDFQLENDTYHPNLIINFRWEITPCQSADAIGCADLYTAVGQAITPTHVQIRPDLTNATTISTIKHELGHTLGLQHGEAPMPLMAAIDSNARERPVRNATERPVPWLDRNITIYIEEEGYKWDNIVDDQIKQTIEYYERGAGGWLTAPPNLTRTNNASAADIRVLITRKYDCGFQYGGICDFRADGQQLDSDRAYEYYTDYSFTLGKINRNHISEWLGYGLGWALGAKNQSDLPCRYADPNDWGC